MSFLNWFIDLGPIQKQLDRMEVLLISIYKKELEIMATLDEVLEKVAEESGDIDSLLTLVDGIRQQLADALADVTLPPEVQEKVDAVFAGIQTNIDKVVTAVSAQS